MVKLYVKVEPGGIPHCVTPTGPSMSFVPFWNIPWKWMDVLWLPSYKVSVSVRVLCRTHHLTWLCTLATTRSPLVKFSKGSGHCPLIPMTGRSAMPSGLARTQVIFQSSVTVSAFVVMARAERPARKHAIDQAMLLTAREYSRRVRALQNDTEGDGSTLRSCCCRYNAEA
jgi:hypothetical protein